MSKLAALAAAITPGEIVDPEGVPGYSLGPPQTIIFKTKPESKVDKFAQLASIEKILNKKFDTTNSVIKLGEKKQIDIPVIPTNILSVDNEVLGCGGIPRGRIIEVFGPESSGKTTVCLHIIAQEQKNTDNLCAFIDAEHALDIKYAAKLGVNIKDLIFAQPDSGEQALETAQALIESKLVSLIVIDSVAALVPQAELNGEMGDSNMGLQARLMSQAMRKLRGIAAQNGITLIFINQIREKIGVMFGNPETTTGGRGLKFFASIRLDIRKTSLIKDGDKPIGHKVRFKGVKNKVATPLQESEIDLLYGLGFDIGADFVSYAVEKGVIEKSGAWYSFNGERLGQGLTKAGECVITNPDLMKQIQERVVKIDEK